VIFPKVISAGQTGAEREALQFAVENDLEFGGWCPKGRRAEDGEIPEDYGLQETNSEELTECVEANVLLANGTVVFTLAPKLGHRARLPVKMAQKHQLLYCVKIDPHQAANCSVGRRSIGAWMFTEIIL
jgi:hypothetical protein